MTDTDYWEEGIECQSVVHVRLQSQDTSEMPREGGEVACSSCDATGNVTYLGVGDHFIQWD